MGANDNRALVHATWDAFARGDVKAAFANLSEDVTWRIPGMIPNLSGVKRGKGEIFGFLGAVVKAFPAGLKSEVTSVHDAGNAVILEMINRGAAANGKAYENQYCFVFEIEGGKIRCIREYVDTQKAMSIIAA